MSSYTEFKVFMWTSLVVEMKTFGKHTNNMLQVSILQSQRWRCVIVEIVHNATPVSFRWFYSIFPSRLTGINFWTCWAVISATYRAPVFRSTSTKWGFTSSASWITLATLHWPIRPTGGAESSEIWLVLIWTTTNSFLSGVRRTEYGASSVKQLPHVPSHSPVRESKTWILLLPLSATHTRWALSTVTLWGM